MKALDQLLDDWRASCCALLAAADLNTDALAAHLRAQEGGYSLAIRLVCENPLTLDGLKVVTESLIAAKTALFEVAAFMPERKQEFSTISDVVSGCIASIGRIIPQEV